MTALAWIDRVRPQHDELDLRHEEFVQPLNELGEAAQSWDAFSRQHQRAAA